MAQVTWYEKDDLVAAAKASLCEVPVVMDVGCGIRPQRLVQAMVHIGIDPFGPYLDVLRSQLGDHPQFILLHGTWDEVMRHFPDQSVDTVIAGDVLEHLDKGSGWRFLAEAERLARQQICLFTPLGHFEQSYVAGKPDRWGMQGGYWQQHRSGWLPDEFGDGWNVLACEKYHFEDEDGQPMAEGFGAFYGILTR